MRRVSWTSTAKAFSVLISSFVAAIFIVPRIIRRYPRGMERLPEREWIRAEDAAAYLQVSRQTLCQYIKKRLLVGRQPKRRGTIYVSTASIRKLLGTAV